MKYCTKCENEIPAGRLKALPNTTTCVSCSSTETVKGITITVGEGDHTYNDVVIVSNELYQEIIQKPKLELEDIIEQIEMINDSDEIKIDVKPQITSTEIEVILKEEVPKSMLEDELEEEERLKTKAKSKEQENNIEEE